MTSRRVSDRAFEYRGCKVIVRAPSTLVLEWLVEFLAPWFLAGPVETPSPALIVEVQVDAELFRNRARAVHLAGPEVECFTMDHAASRLPLARGDGRCAIAVDQANGFALSAGTDDQGIRRIDVLAENERPAARLALARVLRELASAHALRLGDLPIHGAAVAEDRRVTLFVGGKGAGKTTLLVHALTHEHTHYVANDRVFVRLGAGPPMVHGMPTIVSLREGTLALSARLRDDVTSGAWHYASTVAEAHAHQAARTIPQGAGLRSPPGLSPAQLCALLGVSPLAAGPLARIVFTEVGTAEERAFVLRDLSHEEASARLLECGLLAGGRSPTFLSGTPPPDRNAMLAAVRDLAAAVPALSCVLGPRAYATPSAWEAIRDAST